MSHRTNSGCSCGLVVKGALPGLADTRWGGSCTGSECVWVITTLGSVQRTRAVTDVGVIFVLFISLGKSV